MLIKKYENKWCYKNYVEEKPVRYSKLNIKNELKAKMTKPNQSIKEHCRAR